MATAHVRSVLFAHSSLLRVRITKVAFFKTSVLHLPLKHREGSRGVLDLVSFRVMVAVVLPNLATWQ